MPLERNSRPESGNDHQENRYPLSNGAHGIRPNLIVAKACDHGWHIEPQCIGRSQSDDGEQSVEP